MVDANSESQTYAWNWFALHSTQRMQLVNFWLVSTAFLVAAFVQARSNSLRSVAVGVCVTGVISSLGFLMLDARTRRLVQVAEEALRALEKRRNDGAPDTVMALVEAAHAARSSRFSSYRVIIEGLQLAVAVLFFAAGVYSAIA